MRKAQILVLAGLAALAACERKPGDAPKPPPPPNSGPTGGLQPSVELKLPQG